jgi:hypothetical protein
VTGGWAAINTLREGLPASYSADQQHFGTEFADTLGEKRVAALALLEAELDAAERFSGRIDAPEYLREALRAVREGK